MRHHLAPTLTNTPLRHFDALNAMKKTIHSAGKRTAIGFTVLIERLALALRTPLLAA
jgi:hypothetical protein